MNAAAYQRAFDREQLAILCANYDRQIDSLYVESRKLRGLVRDMWRDARLLDANSHIDGMRLNNSKAEDYKRRMEELGVEV